MDAVEKFVVWLLLKRTFISWLLVGYAMFGFFLTWNHMIVRIKVFHLNSRINQGIMDGYYIVSQHY